MKTAIFFILALAYACIISVTVWVFIHDTSDTVYALTRMFVAILFLVFLVKLNIAWDPPKKK